MTRRPRPTTYGGAAAFDEIDPFEHAAAQARQAQAERDAALADADHYAVQVQHICTARNCPCRLKGRFDLPQEQCVTCRTAWPCKYAPSAAEQLALQADLHGEAS